MHDYIGLDVSLKETAISVRRDGRLLAEVIRQRAPQAKRVVFETGPLSVWFRVEAVAPSASLAVACVSHLGRLIREAPSCGDLVSTAKTTVLPAAARPTRRKGLRF